MSVQERVKAISDNSNLSLETPYTTAKIELTGVCSLRCNFCYEKQLKYMGVRQHFMTDRDFQFVLKQIETIPTIKEVGLFYMGESGLHPALAEFYKKLKEKGYFTYLTTNGTAKKVVEAIPYIDSLKVSWNYKNFEDFKNKTGGTQEKYNTIKENIALFYTTCKEHNKSLAVSTVLDTKREDYEEELATLSYDEHYWIPLQTQGGFCKDGLSGVVGEDDHKVSPMPCWSLFKGVYIDVDLNVRTCCYGHGKDHVIGNLKDDSLRNILSSNQLTNMKTMHLRNQIPMQCRKCLA